MRINRIIEHNEAATQVYDLIEAQYLTLYTAAKPMPNATAEHAS